jgi:hypothetical protein
MIKSRVFHAYFEQIKCIGHLTFAYITPFIANKSH